MKKTKNPKTAWGKLFGGNQPSVAGIVMDAEPNGSFSSLPLLPPHR